MCPSSDRITWPLETSSRRTILSAAADAICRPSGENFNPRDRIAVNFSEIADELSVGDGKDFDVTKSTGRTTADSDGHSVGPEIDRRHTIANDRIAQPPSRSCVRVPSEFAC